MHIDKKTINLIQNSLRQASVMWHIRHEVLKEAKTKVRIGDYKNGKPKFKVKYICAVCGKPFNLEDVEVDHVVEVAANLPPASKMSEDDLLVWIRQLFCDKDNLQVVDKGCHALKTMRFIGKRPKMRGR